MTTTDPQTVQSLSRGLAVLRSFSRDAPSQTLAQVAEATGLARATARRFLHTLVAEGYADSDGTHFWLTPKVLELGYAYMSSLGLAALAAPRLEKLSRTLGESSSLSVLDGQDVVYVSRNPVRQIMAVTITIGTRFPAFNTSMGRVLLAGLAPHELEGFLDGAQLAAPTPFTITDPHALRAEIDRVREQGWALVDQELEVGLRSIAAPIYSPAGETIAAINVSTQVAKHDEAELHSVFIPELLRTAELITADVAISSTH